MINHRTTTAVQLISCLDIKPHTDFLGEIQDQNLFAFILIKQIKLIKIFNSKRNIILEHPVIIWIWLHEAFFQIYNLSPINSEDQNRLHTIKKPKELKSHR